MSTDNTLKTIALILAIPLILYEGLVGSTLYMWFVHPFGLPAIGAIHMAGLMVFRAFMFTSVNFKDEKTGEEILEQVTGNFVLGTFVLAIGWGLHFAM